MNEDPITIPCACGCGMSLVVKPVARNFKLTLTRGEGNEKQCKTVEWVTPQKLIARLEDTNGQLGILCVEDFLDDSKDRDLMISDDNRELLLQMARGVSVPQAAD